MSVLDEAITYATKAHANQVDKAGAPYILHPLRVMLSFNTELEMVLGVLHDTAEDLNLGATHIGLCIDPYKNWEHHEEFVKCLDLLTRKHDEPYLDYVKRAASNAVSCKVKIKDVEDNISRLYLIRRKGDIATYERLSKKYSEAINILVFGDGK